MAIVNRRCNDRAGFSKLHAFFGASIFAACMPLGVGSAESPNWDIMSFMPAPTSL
jgi:hypothetical protein